jgi:hypothetical protein
VRFLAGGVLVATVVMLGPAWSLGPSWLALLLAQRWLVLEAWAGSALAITWLLRALAAVIFLRASGGRLKASSAS